MYIERFSGLKILVSPRSLSDLSRFGLAGYCTLTKNFDWMNRLKQSKRAISG